MTPLIEKLNAGETLTSEDIHQACNALLSEGSNVEVGAGFLRALNRKGIAGDELAGFAGELLHRAVPFPETGLKTLDVCGTGGDKAGLFNVSTAVMFVAAGAGAKVVKHGNRGITSQSGGADVLESLGVSITLSPEEAVRMLDKAGCCFLFAPHYHPAVKAVAPVRKLLAAEGTPTIFNLLGPLLNPARPACQLVGIYDGSRLPVYSRALTGLGRKKSWAVHGEGPGEMRFDEISTLGPTQVREGNDGKESAFTIDPGSLGFEHGDLEQLRGGSPAENAGVMENLLSGNAPRALEDLVVLNTAAALVVSELSEDLAGGILRARESISSGAAARVLDLLRQKSA